METPAEPREPRAGGAGSCIDINKRAMEAALVIRQHAGTLSAGFDPARRAEAMVMLSWLIHGPAGSRALRIPARSRHA
jgi:hypothetical protein